VSQIRYKLPTLLALIDVAAERTEPSGSVPGVPRPERVTGLLSLAGPDCRLRRRGFQKKRGRGGSNPPTIGPAYVVDGVAKRKDPCRIGAGFEAPWRQRQAGRDNDDLGRRPLAVLSLTVAEGCCNPSLGDLILAVQAFGVHT
jgi:hypothetical protein